ncbi:MAG: hypothetical protein V7735_12915 [Photobacterium frigidiphilum]|uniref:hypothetical protein n=1 Tax=Photobacterium frigidiphilum TaxID=264736 RepID=UPI00300194C0
MARYTSLDQWPKFETINDALKENYTRIERLRKVGGDEYYELDERLMDCSEGVKSCNSLACKLCNRKFRLQRVNYLVTKIRSKKGRWWVVTIVDYSRAFPNEELDSFDVQKSKDRLRKLLERSGFEGPIVGSFEVDFHERCDLWLPHYHLLCRRTKQNRRAEETLRLKLTSQQPKHIKEDRDPKPLLFQRLKNPYTQISYIYKLVSSSVYDYESWRTGKTITNKKRLSDAMFCQSLCWMDRIGRRRVLFSFGERDWK